MLQSISSDAISHELKITLSRFWLFHFTSTLAGDDLEPIENGEPKIYPQTGYLQSDYVIFKIEKDLTSVISANWNLLAFLMNGNP